MKRAGLDHLLAERVVLLDRAVDPMDVRRLAQMPHLVDPGQQARVADAARRVHGGRVHGGCVQFVVHFNLRSRGSPIIPWGSPRSLSFYRPFKLVGAGALSPTRDRAAEAAEDFRSYSERALGTRPP